MNRSERADLAAATLQILAQGYYVNNLGERIEMADQVDQCRARSACFDPEQLAALERAVVDERLTRHAPAVASSIVVVNETTLEGASSLVGQGQYQRVGVLNFASAKRPGGGFLNGSAAQEEVLARSSALYASLTQHPDFYAHHRRIKNGAYSDRMIYSPGCPVFRDDSGTLLDAPYLVDFVTSPAPNAGAMGKRRGRSSERITAILRQRASKVLALACSMGCDALVLGAWGCGVFRNDPNVVAGVFGELLTEDGPYRGCFKIVRFSIYDAAGQTANFVAFSNALAAANGRSSDRG